MLDICNIAVALGFDLKFCDLGEAHGFLPAPKVGLLEMYVNSSDSIIEQRFTIAHELGHYIYGHRVNPRLRSSCRERKRTTNNENVADAFAGVLLTAVKTVNATGAG